MSFNPDFWPIARSALRVQLGFRRRKASVDRHDIVWIERGHPSPDHPTVVLLHGFAAMKESWASWLQGLPRDWHILAPDIPGFGESTYLESSSYRYELQALRLRDWLASLAVGPLCIVGHSMGAAVATILTDRLAPQVHSLGLVSSAGMPPQSDADPERFPAPKPAMDMLAPADWAGVRATFASVGQGEPNLQTRLLIRLLGPQMIARSEDYRKMFGDLLEDPWAPARHLPSIRVPLMVQWGDRDRITPFSCLGYIRHHRPDARIHEYTGVGHTPMLERPRLSVRDAINFLEISKH